MNDVGCYSYWIFRWSVAEMSEFLVVNGFDEEAVELFRRNKIRGRS